MWKIFEKDNNKLTNGKISSNIAFFKNDRGKRMQGQIKKMAADACQKPDNILSKQETRDENGLRCL